MHAKFTVADNNISTNSSICTELNVHSLITHIFSLQMLDASENPNFLPWLLGSQCYSEQYRSMNSAFSTIIPTSIKSSPNSNQAGK